MDKDKAEKLAKAIFKKKANERINKKLPPSIHDAVEASKNAGEILEALGQGADVIHPGSKVYPHGEENGGIPLRECPDKIEPAKLNQVARERLERQISELMDNVNQSVKERGYIIKDALDVLELARTAVYTHPMGEVSVNLHEAARRFSGIEPQFSKTTNRLGNLAMEIRQSEQVRENKG